MHKQLTEKTDQLDFIKIKNWCYKGYDQESEKIPHWKKIFINHLSNKDLVFRIYELLQLNNEKINIYRMGKGFE